MFLLVCLDLSKFRFVIPSQLRDYRKDGTILQNKIQNVYQNIA